MSTASPTASSVSVGAPSITKLQLPASCEAPTDGVPSKQAVWLIFGATGHMGRSIVRSALSHGDLVTAVGRVHESTLDQVSGVHERCFGQLCDVRVRDTVEHVVKATIAKWGRIDVVVNCTGYGLVAAAEDQTSSDLHDQFQTNFFGTLNIISLTLPYFRTNNIAGRYLIFSSTAGALGVPGLAPYCASKYAVEGLIESMLYEVDCYGIKATLVEPGYVKMDDEEAYVEPDPSPYTQRSRDGRRLRPKTPTRFGHFHIQSHTSEAYNTPTSPSAHAKRVFLWFDKRQPTSAVRSAELIWQLGHCLYPPLRLLLGNFAVESVRDRLRSIIEEIEEWRWLNFPEEGPDGSKGRWVKSEGDDDGMDLDDGTGGDDYGDMEGDGDI